VKTKDKISNIVPIVILGMLVYGCGDQTTITNEDHSSGSLASVKHYALNATDESKPPGFSDSSKYMLPLQESDLVSFVEFSGTSSEEFSRILSGEIISNVLCKEEVIIDTDTSDILRAHSASYLIDLERNTGKIYIRRKEMTFETENQKISKEELMDMAEFSLHQLGLIPEEMDQAEAVSLMVQSKNGGTGAISTEEMAYKIIVTRKIGGVEVWGSKLVVSYKLDGTFYKLVGRWTPIDKSAGGYQHETKSDIVLASIQKSVLEIPGFTDCKTIKSVRNVLYPHYETESGYLLELGVAIGFVTEWSSGWGSGNNPIREEIITYSGEIL
jgi:hypothetical protein